jgi:hypothetical protein
VIVMTGSRTEALARLDAFIGEWVMEARFRDGHPTATGDVPQARSWFEWALGGQFLLQRTEVPIPEAPDSLSVISADPETGAYTQHYYDARGVVRLYAMTFADGTWTLRRDTADFSPLDFRQRFVGTFSGDGNTISGAWETGHDDGEWEHDFALIYRRTG